MKFAVKEIAFYEREVRLRLPFRFGIVTLTEAPQVFVRARIALADGKGAWGAAAELLAPKWFDKDPELSNEENFEQLRASLRLAREIYLGGGANTAFGHFIGNHAPQIALGARRALNPLVASFGPALIDRALLDALCRALNVSFYEAVRGNAVAMAPYRMEFDIDAFLAGLRPAARIAARHTVGLVDPITSGGKRVGDGLPETLEEVIARYGHRWFKLKVAGDLKADLERLGEIAAVLDGIPQPYGASLDGNEQYEDAAGIIELFMHLKRQPKLERLLASVAFIEQPIKRHHALAADIEALAALKPVIIDESDDTLEAFPRARDLGYSGVSSKTCKGLYKSLLNAARCRLWNREEGRSRYFMSGEDLTVQAGLALQHDLALVSLLGLSHVERNGHHYVNGMAGLSESEQEGFRSGHADLYERNHGAVRVRIQEGVMQIASLDCPGYASRAMPDWDAMRRMQ